MGACTVLALNKIGLQQRLAGHIFQSSQVDPSPCDRGSYPKVQDPT